MPNMSRPKQYRRIGLKPKINYFRPVGIQKNKLQEIDLTLDEFESLRLKDLCKHNQIKCAQYMHISQPTFHRVINAARKKIAEALVQGKAINIHGGVIKYSYKDPKQKNKKYLLKRYKK